ncbi:LysR family transcriptional regulator [Pseudorhodoferax sp.]|uniref:LysR family transcriptional regulator n=1 Tax=Pseudorhodoferax sp. TaxID=1993553 RepID=UPI002DD64443|nr:LysR family transcriptional regulator [Pseudorhodoferax sp.]
MKLHYLRYFSVLAEELHFGRAADRLAITQPPLSGAIKALEEEIGVRLFERSSKHVLLTSAGSAFLAEVNQILRRIERAETVAQAVAGGVRGVLEIGVAGSLFYREVPRIMAQFRAAFPEIETSLLEMSSAEQLDGLLHGRIHAGFLNSATVPPQLNAVRLRDDPFVACLPARHQHARATAVSLQSLAHEEFVMFSRAVAPANYDNVIAIFNRAGVHPKTMHAARQWLTITAMVANGMGVSLVPRSLARSEVKGVAFVPLAGSEATSPALFAWNPQHDNQTVRSLVDSVNADMRR